MPKKIIVSVDNFSQSGEATLAEIQAQAAGQGGNAAEVIRDPATGKVIQVNVNLPDTASQVAVDAITNNKGVATVLVFPSVLSDQSFDFDLLAVGAFPVDTPSWAWTRSPDPQASDVGAADDFFVGASGKSLKFPLVTFNVPPGEPGFRRVRVLPGSPLSDLIAPGRTVESETQVRFSAFADITVRLGNVNLTVEFRRAGSGFADGDVRISGVPGLIASGLAINTFHTVKARWTVGSSTIIVSINGDSTGVIERLPLIGRTWDLLEFVMIDPADVWIDDLKVTTVA